ncbi:lysylphosphatidylglycerol synthase transmembrane domain-containing protein [Aureibacter tunicatorum]|uniref:Flippase-like domain-containing protein n=1 Tax=Aureibacter tunicatorum TaxID=866807 RepID=A0AAE4BQ99_9BACT|nr:lysylphosphatidylglycerol synthase transmembrane domain-containing protein [Aureibacter tunicatorum]MDR6237341.1 hypothetical protein [Aureibacter tunicatorum]BDD06332.1 membrane protein [Aureibacter tunicatorum]
MKDKIVSVTKYLITLVIAIAMFAYALKDYSLSSLWNDIKHVDVKWLLLSCIISIASHWARAYRWNLLLKPLGYPQLSSFRTFLAVMSGYIANLAIPRMGEVTRCGILKKTDNVSMSTGIGSVVTERLIDLFTLLGLLGATFLLEYNILSGFTIDFLSKKFEKYENLVPIAVGLGAIFVVLLALAIFAYFRYRSHLEKNAFYLKGKNLLMQASDGLLSLRKVEHPWKFWLSTIVIWALYYLMSYVIFWSIPETSDLTWRAGLAILVFGGMAMAAPAPGGIGTYHIMVSTILLLYGIGEKTGILYATVVHATQTIMILLIGGISLMASAIISKQKNSKEIENDELQRIHK